MNFRWRGGFINEAGGNATRAGPMQKGRFSEGQLRTRRRATMSAKDYTITVTVDQSPEEVFNAINNVRGWWSEEIEGTPDQVGAHFTFHYQDLHRTTQKITELVPGKKVMWHVVESNINFVKDKAEWTDTDVVFEIARKGK